MAVYNYAGGEINVKIVYYGPGVSGKTTNLELMYSKLPRENKGKMVSMKTRTDRTLFFDFLPIEIGDFKGMKVRFLLYTVPGQVYYNATRRLVLKGVDAVVFVADSSPGKMDENIESLHNLEENLNELGMSLSTIPWIIQYNKRDIEGCISRDVLDIELNTWNADAIESVAVTGQGVYETFEGIARKVFESLKDMLSESEPEEEPVDEEPEDEDINVEIVAQGISRNQSSGTDESESLGYAEEREEEHESVSEFVENVLKEGDLPENSIDLGATRGGYEEYGHVVELGGTGAEGEAEEAPKMTVAVEEKKPDFITDPLDNLSENGPRADSDSSDGEMLISDESFEKLVTIPVELTEDQVRNNIPVKVILEIKVTP